MTDMAVDILGSVALEVWIENPSEWVDSRLMDPSSIACAFAIGTETQVEASTSYLVEVSSYSGLSEAEGNSVLATGSLTDNVNISCQTINAIGINTVISGEVNETPLPLPDEPPSTHVSNNTFSKTYLQDRTFLKSLDYQTLKEIYVKIKVLDFNDSFIEEIQGKVSNGQFNIDGNSSVRRTGNLTFVPDKTENNITDVHNIISINKKVKIELGYKNTTNFYTNFSVLWFPIGDYVITDPSFSKTVTGGDVITIQLQDKMCLLNGFAGGTIPSSVTLHEYEAVNKTIISVSRTSEIATITLQETPSGILFGDHVAISSITLDGNSFIGNWRVCADVSGNSIFVTQEGMGDIATTDTSGILTISEQSIPIYNIIQETVNHYGGENLSKIIINDIPSRIKKVLKWWPSDSSGSFLYLNREGDHFRFTDASGVDSTGFSFGENIGYEFAPFVFPDELVAGAGQTVTDVLDKIKSVLGNYEYFYDLDGNFRFQEIKNYLNTSQSTTEIQNLTKEDYMLDQRRSRSVYDFNDNALITSLSKMPSYKNVRNDFVIWGMRRDFYGNSHPIRYHLVLDKKPIPTLTVGENLEDWRNILYRQGVNAEPLGRYSNLYYEELKNEWPKLYDTTGLFWKESVLDEPPSIDYFLDFIDTGSTINELNVSNIGKRSTIVTNDKINCLFAPTIPSLILIEEGTIDTSARIEEAISRQMDYALVAPSLYSYMVIGTDYTDAFSAARELLYQYSSYNNQITIQCIPIYYLEVNTRIGIYDSESGINGDYIINSISAPLSISELMTINATQALERI